MASELIITSARKGLDGGSGFQPVLRTRGMAPSLAERIRIRAGYSHPYTQGDARNPIVFVHRTERVGGENLHFLIRLADAGSDHTGRSNFLAHAIVLDSGEAKRKPAGPAETMRRFPFRTSWDEPSRESGSPTVIGGERPPSPCAAWSAAGLDPGIAGDLAESAMKGETTRVVTRPGDDVLLLFADALALVAPAKRWQVTFTTCEIEPVEANWRAVRSDLPQSRGLASTPGVIDLSRPGARGSDSPYARYARGDAGTVLPWESATSPGSTVPPSPQNDGRSQSTVPPEDGTQNRDRFLEVDGNAGFDLGAAVRLPVVPPQSSVAPPHPGKRNLESVTRTRANAAGTRKPVTFDRPESDPYLAIKYIGGGLLIVATCVGLYVFQSGWLATDEIPQARREPVEPESDIGEQFARDLSKEKLERDRRKSEAEETRKAAEAKAAADLEIAAQQQAENEKKAQAAREAEAAREQEAAAIAAAKKKAFADVALIPDTITDDLPSPSGPLGNETPVKHVDLGPFDFANLVTADFRLAYPRDNFEGATLLADVRRVPDAESPTWSIESTAPNVEQPSQQLLARLVARDGRLHLEPSKDFRNNNWRFALMRRSVLLVIAADPDKTEEPARVVREIRLVRPRHGDLSLTVDPIGGKAGVLPLSPLLPIAIAGSTDGADRKLPLAGCKIYYDATWGEDVQAKAADGSSVDSLDNTNSQATLPLPWRADWPSIVTIIKASFQDGVLTAKPEIRAPKANWHTLAFLDTLRDSQEKQAETRLENNWRIATKLLQSALTEKQAQSLVGSLKNCELTLRDFGMPDEEKELNGAVRNFMDKASGKVDAKSVPEHPRESLLKVLAAVERKAKDRVGELLEIRSALRKPLTIRVTHIASDAYDGDDKYEVPLFISGTPEDTERQVGEGVPSTVQDPLQ